MGGRELRSSVLLTVSVRSTDGCSGGGGDSFVMGGGDAMFVSCCQDGGDLVDFGYWIALHWVALQRTGF